MVSDRREKHRTYGRPLQNACQATLPNHQSIKDFLNRLSPDCVAHERYADGTLYFSGSLTQRQRSENNIVPKPGWKPEIRRSRTLSLVVKAAHGEAPRLTVDDALDIVRQSPLWKDVPHVELIRIANTNGKASHVFVQFEGEIMARRNVNVVDAMPYTHRDSGKRCFVHGSQLNAYYEYEPQPGGAFDPLVWRNPHYSGMRSVTLSLRDSASPDLTKKADVKGIPSDALVSLIEGALGGSFAQQVESVRRVDMEKTGINVVVQVRTGRDPTDCLQDLARGTAGMFVKSQTSRSLVVMCAGLQRSRQGDSEVSDNLLWNTTRPASVCESSDSEDDLPVAETFSSRLRVDTPSELPPSPATSSSVESAVAVVSPAHSNFSQSSRSQSLLNLSSAQSPQGSQASLTNFVLTQSTLAPCRPPLTPQSPQGSSRGSEQGRMPVICEEVPIMTSYDSEMCQYFFE